MSRPRNEELSSRVRTAVINQLLSRGLASTSYASIAKAAGTTRAVVQAYYPHKTDMANEYSRVSSDIAMEITEAPYKRLPMADEQAKKIAHLFLSGSLYFEFMQRDDTRRSYLAEILRDRDQAEALIFMIADFSFAEINRDDVIEDPAYRNDIIMSIGGLFELLYYHLKHGIHFDPAIYYGQMTRVWMIDAGFGENQIAEVLACSATELEDIDNLVAQMEARFKELHYL